MCKQRHLLWCGDELEEEVKELDLGDRRRRRRIGDFHFRRTPDLYVTVFLYLRAFLFVHPVTVLTDSLEMLKSVFFSSSTPWEFTRSL